MPRYTEGICQDGAAILKDGQQITVDQILRELNEATELRPIGSELSELLDGFIFFVPEKDHDFNYPAEIYLGTSDWVIATDGEDIFPAVFDLINHSWSRPNWTKSPLADVFWQRDINVIAWKPLTKLEKPYVVEACSKQLARIKELTDGVEVA